MLEIELFDLTMTVVNVYSRCVSCVGGFESLLTCEASSFGALNIVFSQCLIAEMSLVSR